MPSQNCCPPSGTQWAPQEAIHLQGTDCAGNLTDFVGKPTQLVNTVPVPGSVQLVKLCPSSAQSSDLSVTAHPIIWDGDGYWESGYAVITPTAEPTIKIYDLAGVELPDDEWTATWRFGLLPMPYSTSVTATPTAKLFEGLVVGSFIPTYPTTFIYSYQLAAFTIYSLAGSVEYTMDSGDNWIPLTPGSSRTWAAQTDSYITATLVLVRGTSLDAKFELSAVQLSGGI